MAAETLPRPVPERFCYAPPLLEWLRDPANTRPALVSEGWRVIHRIHFEKAAEAIGLANWRSAAVEFRQMIVRGTVEAVPLGDAAYRFRVATAMPAHAHRAR